MNTSQYRRPIWSLKLDHAFTPNNRLAFTLTEEKELTDSVTALPGALGQGLYNLQRPDNWRFNHDLVIKPNAAPAQHLRLFTLSADLEQP